MEPATVTHLPTGPRGAEPQQEFECPECGRSFSRAQALGRHRNSHGVAGKTAKPAAPKPEKRKAPSTLGRDLAVPERDLLAVVAGAYHDLNGADIATAIESAATIIDAIAAAGWRVIETA